MKKNCFILIFVFLCSCVYSVPGSLVSSDIMSTWGINYSFGPQNGKSAFGIFCIVDFAADRSKSYWAPGLEAVFVGDGDFRVAFDMYYFINPWTTSYLVFPLKFGIGAINPGIDLRSGVDVPWYEFAGYTVSAGIMYFAAKISDDGKSYFTPYLFASLDGNFTGKINPKLEISPAFTEAKETYLPGGWLWDWHK